MSAITRILISFGFLGVAFLLGYLTHSKGVFTAILLAGIVVRLVLRRAR